MIKVSDIQFIKYFLIHEIDANELFVRSVLDRPFEINITGSPDTVANRGSTLIYHRPSSITMFLFTFLYTILKDIVKDSVQQDKLGLGLLYMCRDYVYADFDPREFSGPPVIIDFNKLAVPSFIVQELIEPLLGSVNMRPLLFIPCKFTDTARIIESPDQIEDEYNLPPRCCANTDFPLVLVNCNIHNSAAQLSHLTVKSLELALGKDKSQKVIRNILLGEDSLSSNLVQILKTLNGEPHFVIDFLKFFRLGTTFTRKESEDVILLQRKNIESDNYLKEHIKVAAPPNAMINKQWSQWSMLMGLIEKQLEPMRGSMWPTSENVKPHEDRLRLMIKEKSKKRGKNQANFEEMLETARDLYNHNAVEPGKLIETLLKRNRVWKT